MKLLKPTFLLLFAMIGFLFSYGQDSIKQVPQQKSTLQGTQQSKDDSKRDFDSHMAKLQQSYNKMKVQESKVRDPKMKADMDAMITKMSKVNSDYNAMKNNTGMSEAQQEESRSHIQSEMKEIRRMHEDMKQKYPDQMGQKGKHQQPKDQKTPPDQSTSDPLYN